MQHANKERRPLQTFLSPSYSNRRFTALMYESCSETGVPPFPWRGAAGAGSHFFICIHPKAFVLHRDKAQPLPLGLLQSQAGRREMIYLTKWWMTQSDLQELRMCFSNTFQAQKMPRKHARKHQGYGGLYEEVREAQHGGRTPDLRSREKPPSPAGRSLLRDCDPNTETGPLRLLCFHQSLGLLQWCPQDTTHKCEPPPPALLQLFMFLQGELIMDNYASDHCRNKELPELAHVSQT